MQPIAFYYLFVILFSLYEINHVLVVQRIEQEPPKL